MPQERDWSGVGEGKSMAERIFGKADLASS
jgi:hypothetical protein